MFVATVSVYAWRDWYKAVCGLILMMAVIQHPDMPKTMLGIQGLNPWNVALASVMAAWWAARKKEGLRWDLPRKLTVLVSLYMVIAFVSFLRMMVDREVLHETIGYLVGDHLINVFKWVMPALLLYDGCRSRERFRVALFATLAVYVLLALQVIRWIPLSFAMDGESLEARSHKIISNEIGYHRVNMSMMLAGASWAVFVSSVIGGTITRRLSLIALGLVILLGQALTAGRAGYATWGIVGMSLALLRWKRYLVLAPVLAVAVITFVPGVAGRMTQGFSEETKDTNSRIESNQTEVLDADGTASEPDLYTITSGRNFAWPFVIAKIRESVPSVLFGHGKAAMRRTGITKMLMEDFGENFPHPHNAYLELLLDTGLVGFVVVIPFYFLVLKYSFSLFRDSRSIEFVAAGGVCAALVLALLIAAMGSQTFYPREGAVGMWAAIGLMLRVWMERQKAEAMSRQPEAPSATAAPPPAAAAPNGFNARIRTQHVLARQTPARRTAGSPQPRARARRTADSQAGLDGYLWRNAA